MGPGLFTGAMTLGVLIQTSSAFREVQSSFSLFLQIFPKKSPDPPLDTNPGLQPYTPPVKNFPGGCPQRPQST